ncbi:MAG: AAA family ATPase [Desulfobacterales bacterium]|nr:AAA family ATPase [Desulfobacterales bacterium]
MKKKVLYGSADYEEIVRKNGYFVDKTAYIEKLESVENPIFLRPRRFGKSLLCRILECYYNIKQKKDFERLFGDTYIGKHPTPLSNSFFVLHLDFSIVNPTGDIKDIEKSFNHICNSSLRSITRRYSQWFGDKVTVNPEIQAAHNLNDIMVAISDFDLPSLYIIIDEYDNFANQLIVANKDNLYRQLTSDEGFFKNFFKTLKEGRKTSAIENIFITGVLPITIDDLASGFNIGTFITLEPKFESMIGFTQSEVSQLLSEIYRDYDIDISTLKEVESIIKNHYNGYNFVNTSSESLYNSTILMYFLRWFCEYKQIPESLTDMNLRTDLSWVRRITGTNPQNTEEFVSKLTTENNIAYDKNFLTNKFNMFQFFEKGFYPISFFYLGMLTRQDDFYLKLPNLNMKQIFVEYFNEIHRIDVSTKYAKMMQGFVNNPDLSKLFADYWELYVSQLPEAIFQQVNENFYRTTFFELCSRYLSKWFTWNLERSYPKGKTDLEFVGKYHEKFAGMRIIIEFKYYSNSEFKKFKTTIQDFKIQNEDTIQISGYIEGLKQEYPECKISQYVIYCFGNQGFRVFEIMRGY